MRAPYLVKYLVNLLALVYNENIMLIRNPSHTENCSWSHLWFCGSVFNLTALGTTMNQQIKTWNFENFVYISNHKVPPQQNE